MDRSLRYEAFKDIAIPRSLYGSMWSHDSVDGDPMACSTSDPLVNGGFFRVWVNYDEVDRREPSQSYKFAVEFLRSADTQPVSIYIGDSETAMFQAVMKKANDVNSLRSSG